MLLGEIKNLDLAVFETFTSNLDKAYFCDMNLKVE